MLRHVVATFAILVIFTSDISAQRQAHVHAGGTFAGVYQTQFDHSVGGLALGGSALFGVFVSPRVAIEFEPLFGGPYSWEYTYHPGPSRTAHVVASRHDTFFSFQIRSRAGDVEPVIGVSIVRGRISRHATSAGRPYFDDARAQNGVALVGGLDGRVELARRAFFVPTFRVLVVTRSGTAPDPFNDPLGDQTDTGPLVFRLGAGMRVTF
ncbi:MAG TPA: hypothetical protein VJ691_02090 [Vicinamibacterales bacterium]|nr:hypothetical protein [Vicinamibacterales bacterium]